MNAKQIKLLTALLDESTISKAAEKAGITRATAYKYLQDKDFQRVEPSTIRVCRRCRALSSKQAGVMQ